MFLFKIGISTIFSFVFGIAIGIAICTLLYLAYVSAKMNSKSYKLENVAKINKNELPTNLLTKRQKKKLLNDTTPENANELVSNAINEYLVIFNDRNLKGSKSNIEFSIELIKCLYYDIAKIYFPDSKNPVLEVNIDEALEVFRYSASKIHDLLSFNGISFLRKVKLNTILNVMDITRVIENSNIVKLSKKIKLNRILLGFKIVLNIVNPLYWVRKAIVDTSFNIIIKRICMIMIGVTGEEAYKLYSKKIFATSSELKIEALDNNVKALSEVVIVEKGNDQDGN